MECAASIGWRHHELLTLRVKQIDLEHRVIRLEPNTTKNDEGREAPVTDVMLQLLSACMEDTGQRIGCLPGLMAAQSRVSATRGPKRAARLG